MELSARVGDFWSTSNVYLNEIKVPLEILRPMTKNNNDDDSSHRWRGTTVKKTLLLSPNVFFHVIRLRYRSYPYRLRRSTIADETSVTDLLSRFANIDYRDCHDQVAGLVLLSLTLSSQSVLTARRGNSISMPRWRKFICWAEKVLTMFVSISVRLSSDSFEE